MHLCTNREQLVEKTLDLSVASPATYDVVTAQGDIVVYWANFYCTVVGATWTSVSVQTDQAVPVVFLTATEGAVANIVAGSHPVAACTLWASPVTLRSGQKIQYSMIGAQGTGTLKMFFMWQPLSNGAVLL